MKLSCLTKSWMVAQTARIPTTALAWAGVSRQARRETRLQERGADGTDDPPWPPGACRGRSRCAAAGEAVSAEQRNEPSAARSNRLLAFGGLLVLCSPGVLLLGWGFSVGMVAGCAISYGLWRVNRG